jgi:hypothetical protein
MATLSKIKKLIIEHCDPDEVCDGLEISTEMLLERFMDILAMRFDRFEYLEEDEMKEIGDEETVDYDRY